MDIILDTRFNNPILPTTPVTGFYDDFSRPPGPLGRTLNDKLWEYAQPWQVTERGTASNIGGSQTAVVDAGAADGVLEGIVAKGSDAEADNRFGLTFRYADAQNYCWIANNSTGEYGTATVYVRANGTTVVSETLTGHTLSTGDTISIAMVRSSITIRQNGLVIYSGHVPYHTGATKHGFYSQSTANAEWAQIRFA